MTRENEQSIITSSGLDNEIRELCQARDFAEAMVQDSPRGSCDYLLFKSQLKGIENRLEELGIDVVVREERKTGDDLGEIITRREISRFRGRAK